MPKGVGMNQEGSNYKGRIPGSGRSIHGYMLDHSSFKRGIFDSFVFSTEWTITSASAIMSARDLKDYVKVLHGLFVSQMGGGEP